ncbi:chorismate-binding protein [Halobacillus shinanisalinarum]|uniref:Chorismate-binding protein n=1 Tax=Halobacillus shinanisalinarum TaxID=2932258 RepID=A0ABY4H1E6_9BACI|nr:chorismate-binding protein [Halobacillus shinanisalinarum]UOQ94208.1 chorismate-binding protein [Halobacillus shinanisalinarum]
MLHIKVPQLEEIVEGAINQASLEGKPQLISIVNEIEYTSSYDFLDRAKGVDQHRLFWKSAGEDFAMVGVGSAHRILSADSHRFREIESVWNELRKKARVYDPFYVKGTGLVALGGFSFDANQSELTPWEAFPDSQVTIPAYLLTNKGMKSYLSTNVLIFEEDHKQQIIHQINEQQHQLLHGERQELKLPGRTSSVEMESEKWKQSIKQATNDIKKGKLGKVVLARELRVKFNAPVELAAVVEELCETQSNSYIFAFENGGDHFIGATPERLVKVEKQKLISTCLAGRSLVEKMKRKTIS